MDPILSEQQSLLRDAATKLARASGGPRRARELRDSGQGIDRQTWEAMREAGWLASLVREEHGGLGLNALDLALALEEAGKQLVMVPLAEAAAAAWAMSQITAGRTAPAHLHGVLAGANLVLPATSSPEWRWKTADDAPAMCLHVDPKAAVLEGSIEFVPFAGAADVFLVDAIDKHEARSLCLAPRHVLAQTARRNVDGSSSSLLTTSGTAIPLDSILASGEVAARIAGRMRELLVLWTSAELLGVAQGALDMTSDYLKLRKQFGKPIGSFQALQHRMVDCFVDLELSRSLLYRVLRTWDESACHPAMVSACKARLSRGALATVRVALQLHGAIGYTDEHDIGLYYKRAVALAAKYGNEILHVDAFSAAMLPT